MDRVASASDHVILCPVTENGSAVCALIVKNFYLKRQIVYLLLIANFIPIEKKCWRQKSKNYREMDTKTVQPNFMSTAKKIIHRHCHEMHAAYAYRSNFMVTAVGTLVSHGGAHT